MIWWGLPQSPTRPAANNPIFFLAELQFLWGFFIQAILGKLDLSFQWTVDVKWSFPRSNTPKTSGPRISIWYVQFPQLKVDWSGSRSLDTSRALLSPSVFWKFALATWDVKANFHHNAIRIVWGREHASMKTGGKEECMLVAEEDRKREEGSPIQFLSIPLLGASFHCIFTTFCRLNMLALGCSPHLRKTFIRQKEMLEQIGALPSSPARRRRRLAEALSFSLGPFQSPHCLSPLKWSGHMRVYRVRLKGCSQVWWILFLPLLTTSSWACLQHSPNLAEAF